MDAGSVAVQILIPRAVLAVRPVPDGDLPRRATMCSAFHASFRRARMHAPESFSASNSGALAARSSFRLMTLGLFIPDPGATRTRSILLRAVSQAARLHLCRIHRLRFDRTDGGHAAGKNRLASRHEKIGTFPLRKESRHVKLSEDKMEIRGKVAVITGADRESDAPPHCAWPIEERRFSSPMSMRPRRRTVKLIGERGADERLLRARRH